MSVAEIKTHFTPDDLLQMPEAVNYELVEGKLVERHMGSESSAVAAAIAAVLFGWSKSIRAGHIFTTDCGYQCFPDEPEKVRKPDVSFVRKGRLPNNRPPDGYILIAPDLAVEVLSPGDLASEVDDKVVAYLAAGVKLIWIVNPKTRIVRIHRPSHAPAGPIGVAAANDTISGEEVLPGFTCRVAEFFEI